MLSSIYCFRCFDHIHDQSHSPDENFPTATKTKHSHWFDRKSIFMLEYNFISSTYDDYYYCYYRPRTSLLWTPMIHRMYAQQIWLKWPDIKCTEKAIQIAQQKNKQQQQQRNQVDLMSYIMDVCSALGTLYWGRAIVVWYLSIHCVCLFVLEQVCLNIDTPIHATHTSNTLTIAWHVACWVLLAQEQHPGELFISVDFEWYGQQHSALGDI